MESSDARREAATLTASRHARRLLMIGDSFLSNAGWFFFTAWGLAIAIVGCIAFGRELRAWKALFIFAQNAAPPRPAAPDRSKSR
jgi:hypothetical protein